MTAFVSKNRPRLLVWSALGLILLIGGALRFQAINWDQGQYFHPDERAIVSYTGWLNEVPLTTDEYGPRQHIEFPPGGLSFFWPNAKSNLRQPTPQEAQSYYVAKKAGQKPALPPNVVPPDEPVPAEAINFWNANYSPLNPHWFAYGSFPLYLIKLGAHLAGVVTGQDWSDNVHLTYVGRFLSAVWSMGTLVLTFLLARLIFLPALGRRKGEAIGLLATAFLAVTVLDIQLAHYAATDVTLTFFLILSVYLGVRLMRSGRKRTALALGAAMGLALACKVSALPVVLVAGVAALLYGLYGRASQSGEYAGRPRMRAWDGPETARYGVEGVALGPRLLVGTVLNLLIAGFAMLLVWFLAMPYAFLDFANFSKRIIEEAGMSRGNDSFVYTRQYVGTTPFLYQGAQLVQWCMGWPLGLLALAGLGLSLWQSVRKRLKAEIVLLSFLLPYALATFSAEAKFDRYLLPVVPLLVILAARLIVVAAGTVQPERVFTRWRGRIATGLALLTFLGAGLWAISFSHIYSGEHTMNQASRWMFQNIPNGATIANEWWDETLPRNVVPGQSLGTKGWCDPDTLAQKGICDPIMMDIYGDQPNQEKVEYFVSQLKKTDYILINSNRLYATMPKLPWRYPVQIRYYELLFGGKLGYENVATFSDYPTLPLLNWPINDDGADESFTVYDHPKVFIFKKTKPLADDEIRGLFANAAKAPQIVKRYPGPNDLPVRIAGQGDGVLDSATAGQVKNDGKTLLLDRPVDRLPVIDDLNWNSLANDNQWLAVIMWFGLIQLIGLVALPITWRICRRLPDRGYILAKPVGALLVALVIWLLVATRFVMNTALTAWLALALTAACGVAVGWRHRADIWGWLRTHRRLILIEEGIFLAIFLSWTLFRLGNPDLWHPFFGGEKPMEMSYLLGILKSPYFPPYDPWFADGYINYYYYGQYLVSTWIKLSGISPFIAFNLAVPLLYAFTCSVAFSLVYNLASHYKTHRARFDRERNPQGQRGPIVAGFFGMTIFALVGNLDGLIQLLQRWQPVVDLANNLKLYPDKVEALRKFDYFRSSRVIPGTINEFPSFSFIYSDLHAHLIALPFTLVAMVLAFNLLLTDWSSFRETDRRGRPVLWRMTFGRLWQVFDGTLVMPIVLMALIGFLGATNSWDLPTYLVLISAAFFLALFRRYFAARPEALPSAENSLNLQADPAPTSQVIKPRLTLPSLAIDLGLTGLVLGTTLGGGLALYWNFFGNFQAFFTQIALVPDRLAPYYDGGKPISGHSEFQYFLVIFLLPLFLIVSYLLWSVRDWWRVGRGPLPAEEDEDSDYGDDEGEWEDEWDEEETVAARPNAVQPTLPGFGLSLNRPELALSMASAGDAGSNSGFGSGSGRGPGGPIISAAGGSNRFVRRWLFGLAAFVVFVLIVGAAAPNNWLTFSFALALVGCLAVLSLGRAFDRRRPEQVAESLDESALFARLMLLAAFGIVAVTEVVYLKDDMGEGEFARMNTIFKFYYQVWALVCLGAGFLAYLLWKRWIAPAWASFTRRRGGLVGRVAWLSVLAVLLFFVLLYPVQAIPARLADRSSDPLPPASLDGRLYFKTMRPTTGMPEMPDGKSFDLTYDAQSLFDFYAGVKGTPVVLQANIAPYRGGGSWIPINTGLPGVLGWDHHERQQRWPEMVENRSGRGGQYGLIRQVYNTASIQEALELLNHFHVTYIHMGTIERESEYEIKDALGNVTVQPYMSEEGYAKFEGMAKLGLLEVAYQNPGAIVYRLTAKGESGVVTGDPTVAGNVNITDPKLSKLEAAVKAAPNNPQAYYNLGRYYYDRKQYDKAAASLETVLRLEPNKVNPYHVLGDIYRDAGDNEKALAQYKKATEIGASAEEIPAAFNKYGVALQALGRYDEALKQFNEVIKRDKHFNEAFFHMGEVYESQGKKDAAINAYQQTITGSQKQDDFWTRRSLQKIRDLGSK